MKFALFVIAVVALVWLIRSAATRRVNPPNQAEPNETRRAQPMLICAVCGVHMPRDEALPGRGGVFCTEAHRTAFEQRPPGP